MKIVLINASYPPNFASGAEKAVQRLAEALVEAGHEAIVVTSHPKKEPVIGAINGVKVHYLPVANLYALAPPRAPGAVRRAIWHLIDTYNPVMRDRVATILRQERPDVVNTHNLVGFSTAVLEAVKACSFPLVHTLHDQYFLCPKSTMFKRGRNCRRPCLTCRLYAIPRKTLSSRVDVVVGVSEFILNRHLRRGYFAGTDRKVIYNGIEARDQAPARGAGADGRSFRFGYLGQIRETKGLHELIGAFMEECPTEAELWIAGRGDAAYEETLRRRSARVPSVRWLGFTDPGELLRAVDVLVVPSIWSDTAPLVIVEAFAESVPVLGSNRGGIPEFISPGTGWVYDADQSGALRAALRNCLDSRTRIPEMGLQAKARVGCFSRAEAVRRYLEAYGAAVDRCAAHAKGAYA